MKVLTFSTRERLLSSDLDRSISLGNRALGETLRYLLDVYTDSSGVSSEHLGQTSPVIAEILGGLMVRPAVGSANMTVDSGMVCFIDPSGASAGVPLGTNSPDDSVLKLVSDVGVPVAGTLALTANSSGSIRIDVVECARVEGGVTTSESRDTYDISSGLFSSGTVLKTVADSLQYRIRTGVAPGSFTAQGWLPLAVMSVPTGTTTLDTVTIWDVRPLASDRQGNIMNVDSGTMTTRARVNAVDITAVSGVVEGYVKGRRAGGPIRRGTPGVDAATVDTYTTVNRDPSSTFTDRYPFAAWFIFPQSLPRWCRYTDYTTGARLPGKTKGIFTISAVLPSMDGLPMASLTVPSSTGLGAVSTQTALLAYCGWWNTSQPYAVSGDLGSGFCAPASLAGGTLVPTVVGSGSVALTALFTLNGGIHFPACARALKLDMFADLAVASGGNFMIASVTVVDSVGNDVATTFIGTDKGAAAAAVNSTSGNRAYSAWVEIPYGTDTRIVQIRVGWQNDNAALTLGSGSVHLKLTGIRL
jgi:hypothetical protein